MTFSSTRYSMPCSPPVSIDCGLFLSCAFRSLQSSILLSSAVASYDDRLSWGFLLLRDTSVGVHLVMGFPYHLCFAHSVSHTLDDLLLLAPCGLVSSHYRVRDFSSGVFPDTQPDKLSFGRTFLSLTSQATSRLQGLYRFVDPLHLRQDLPVANARSPLEFQLPWVFLCTP